MLMDDRIRRQRRLILQTQQSTHSGSRGASLRTLLECGGLKRKLTDVDFINYINNFDIFLLGETWLNKNDETNYDIKGFLCDHVFASKSLGARKGRYSGGISVYYRTQRLCIGSRKK